MAINGVDVELWQPVVGWTGLYEVSNLGVIRSLDRDGGTDDRGRRRYRSGRVLKPSYAGAGGYPRVTLKANDVTYCVAIHQVVMLAFVGPCPDGLEVRHLNGDPRDAQLTNLQYGTPKENLEDRHRHGTAQALFTQCANGHSFNVTNTGYNRGYRICLTCKRERSKQWIQNKRSMQRAGK